MGCIPSSVAQSGINDKPEFSEPPNSLAPGIPLACEGKEDIPKPIKLDDSSSPDPEGAGVGITSTKVENIFPANDELQISKGHQDSPIMAKVAKNHDNINADNKKVIEENKKFSIFAENIYGKKRAKGAIFGLASNNSSSNSSKYAPSWENYLAFDKKYDHCHKFYVSQLNVDELRIYNRIRQGILDLADEVDLSKENIKADEIKKVHQIFSNELPQTYWVASARKYQMYSTSSSPVKYLSSIKLDYTIGYEAVKLFNEKICKDLDQSAVKTLLEGAGGIKLPLPEGKEGIKALGTLIDCYVYRLKTQVIDKFLQKDCHENEAFLANILPEYRETIGNTREALILYALNHHVCHSTDYLLGDYGSEDVNTLLNYSMYGPLFHGKAVCQGYTHLITYLLNRCDVETSFATSGNHIWYYTMFYKNGNYTTKPIIGMSDTTWSDRENSDTSLYDVSFAYVSIPDSYLLDKREKVAKDDLDFDIPVATEDCLVFNPLFARGLTYNIYSKDTYKTDFANLKQNIENVLKQYLCSYKEKEFICDIIVPFLTFPSTNNIKKQIKDDLLDAAEASAASLTVESDNLEIKLLSSSGDYSLKYFVKFSAVAKDQSKAMETVFPFDVVKRMQLTENKEERKNIFKAECERIVKNEGKHKICFFVETDDMDFLEYITNETVENLKYTMNSSSSIHGYSYIKTQPTKYNQKFEITFK